MAAWWLLREQERHREPESPIRSTFRAFDIAPVAEGKAHRLAADLHELAHTHIERHRPLPGFPVVSGLGVQPESGKGFRGERNERLDERGADGRALVVARERPDVV